ncbi:hypothetical protein DFH09DRAFT_1094278 [Mycena vulgaris]|nr:hypothetical protein DFH09DRAFT_1094278 [Mycena vulgaris]
MYTISCYNGIPRRTSVTVVCFVLVLFLAPTLLQSFLDAAPLIIALTWAVDKFMQGLTSLALIISAYTFSSLARNGHRWLTSAPDDTSTAGPPSGRAPILKVVRAAGTLIFFYSQLLRREIVSLQSPLLENVGAALLFLSRGLEVLLVEFLLLLRVCCLKGPTSRSAVTPLEAAGRAATGLLRSCLTKGQGRRKRAPLLRSKWDPWRWNQRDEDVL